MHNINKWKIEKTYSSISKGWPGKRVCRVCGKGNKDSLYRINEHYVYCTECEAITTKHCIIESKCKHINDKSFSLIKIPKSGINIPTHITKEDKCSICNIDVLADGW